MTDGFGAEPNPPHPDPAAGGSTSPHPGAVGQPPYPGAAGQPPHPGAVGQPYPGAGGQAPYPGADGQAPYPGAAASPYGYQQPWPGGPVPPAKGLWLGVAALVLGLLALVLPFLPVDMTGFRAYVPFPFGLAGLVLGVLGCVGRRSGKPMAAVGIALSALALVAGLLMLAGTLG
ncbi:hypothetical protein [Amycolatopsis sp. NPDC098790]|uniref:hypothetical protein n=1 Tax=Amycolatopsis sp. NPDC098790 TaxID=3363939 RepID=UPI003817785B